MGDRKPDYFYKHDKALHEVDEDTFEIRGINRKQAWIPTVIVPQINDPEVKQDHDLDLDTVKRIVTVFVSGGRKLSRALNEALNKQVEEVLLKVPKQDWGGSYAKYCSEKKRINFDYVACRTLLEDSEYRALVGLWAHEVGHALTMGSNHPLSQLLGKYDKKQHFDERSEIVDLTEQWADQAVEAIGFGREYEALDRQPKERTMDIMEENGLFD